MSSPVEGPFDARPGEQLREHRCQVGDARANAKMTRAALAWWDRPRRGVPISRLAAVALRRPPTHGHAAQLHGGFQPHAETRNTNSHPFRLPIGHAIALRGRVCGRTVRTRRPPPVSARGTRAAVHVEPRRRDLTLTLEVVVQDRHSAAHSVSRERRQRPAPADRSRR
jgi:hypothetical protein